MEQDTLTFRQKQAIAALASEPSLNDAYYLTGGTALAGYYLGHRISDDLDFFCLEEADRMFLHEFAEELRKKLNAATVRYERIYDRSQFFFVCEDEELKIEFTKYPFPQLEAPVLRDGIKVDSLRDIAANKLMAMLDRFEPKDFVDLYFLLQNRVFSDVRRDAEEKFKTKIGSLFLGTELLKARRIEGLPRMIQPLKVEELRDFFTDRAQELAPEILR